MKYILCSVFGKFGNRTEVVCFFFMWGWCSFCLANIFLLDCSIYVLLRVTWNEHDSVNDDKYLIKEEASSLEKNYFNHEWVIFILNRCSKLLFGISLSKKCYSFEYQLFKDLILMQIFDEKFLCIPNLYMNKCFTRKWIIDNSIICHCEKIRFSYSIIFKFKKNHGFY